MTHACTNCLKLFNDVLVGEDCPYCSRRKSNKIFSWDEDDGLLISLKEVADFSMRFWVDSQGAYEKGDYVESESLLKLYMKRVKFLHNYLIRNKYQLETLY